MKISKINALKTNLQWTKGDLEREREKTAKLKEFINVFAAFAGGLINSYDAVAYKRAVEVLNELQVRAANV